MLFRIDELQQTLRHTQSEDVREAIQQALATCWKRLAALDARIGTGVRRALPPRASRKVATVPDAQ